jgi:hypothetical protein
MQPDPDRDLRRAALARQVLDEWERRGLRVWQQFGAAHISATGPGPAPVGAETLAAAGKGPV